VPGIGFEGRPQLAARLRGSGGGGHSLLLNGHIDVVPARQDDGWTADPFDAQVVDGNVVGRGACDMKGGIAAMVLAAEVLGFAFTIYLWTQLSSLTFKVGLSWLAVGFIYLLALTRGFRKPPPAMYTGEEDA
jgi:Peptidase family M20/M25/M40